LHEFNNKRCQKSLKTPAFDLHAALTLKIKSTFVVPVNVGNGAKIFGNNQKCENIN